VPTFDGNIKEPALALWSAKIPFDGDPQITETDGSLDWEEPYVAPDLVPLYMPPVSTSSTRVIILDLFGTILVSSNMRIVPIAHPQSGS
jgi:hypothetical protein